MRFKIFAITAATLLLSQPAAAKTAKHNIVVQSYRDIQNSNMYEPGFNQGGYKMGAISPEDALTYMKNTPDLVIVEVNAPEWKLSTGFTGAMYIPYTEMAERYDEIPEGRPVLLHCGGGIVSVDAYKILQEKRPDIPELSYIAGAPPVRAYNEWLSGQEINS